MQRKYCILNGLIGSIITILDDALSFFLFGVWAPAYILVW